MNSKPVNLEQVMVKNFLHSLILWPAQMFYMLLCGVVIAALAAGLKPWDIFGIALDGPVKILGESVIIAAILGLTVEPHLRREFAEEISRDVFAKTMGWVLPEQLKEVMADLYRHTAVCEDHDQDVWIDPIVGKEVKVRTTIQRKIKNITRDTQHISVGLDTDEWFSVEGPTQIVSLAYRIEGKPRRDLSPADANRKEVEWGRPVMKAKSQTVPVPPGKTITIWMEFSEIKPRNSDHNSHFAVPTLRCNVRLHPATGISAVALFPRDEGKSVAFETNYTYEKLLLPGQEIRIRWWDTAEFDCGIRGMENDKVTSFTGGDDPELGGAVRMRLPF